jgi:hypothetical protein
VSQGSSAYPKSKAIRAENQTPSPSTPHPEAEIILGDLGSGIALLIPKISATVTTSPMPQMPAVEENLMDITTTLIVLSWSSN